MFMLSSICVEASESNSDVLNLSMSLQSQKVIVGKDNSTIFMLPLNQRLLEIRGGDVILNVDGKYTDGVETNDWIVSSVKKRGSSKRAKWTYQYNVKLQPKKDVVGTEFEFVTDKWVHKVYLSSGICPSSLVIINNDSFFDVSGLMDFVLNMDPLILVGVSVLILCGSLWLFFMRWSK